MLVPFLQAEILCETCVPPDDSVNSCVPKKKCVHTNVGKCLRVPSGLRHLNMQNYELGFMLTPFQAYTHKGDCHGFPWWLYLLPYAATVLFYLSVLYVPCILLYLVLKALLCAVCTVPFAKHKLFVCSVRLECAVHYILEQKL